MRQFCSSAVWLDQKRIRRKGFLKLIRLERVTEGFLKGNLQSGRTFTNAGNSVMLIFLLGVGVLQGSVQRPGWLAAIEGAMLRHFCDTSENLFEVKLRGWVKMPVN